ncbi:MAG TPA: hypothetical protein VIK93_05520, partial [Limnochordales bacterium]
MATVLQLKDLFTVWLAAGNALAAVWALILYFLKRSPNRLFWQATVFLQVLMLVQVALGVTLIVGGLFPNSGHLLYGVLNGLLALVRVGWYTRISAAGPQGTL